MTKFTLFFRILWLVTIISIFFVNRENILIIYSIISMLILLTVITVIRIIESRNQWRRMIKEGDIEIKDKISFD